MAGSVVERCMSRSRSRSRSMSMSVVAFGEKVLVERELAICSIQYRISNTKTKTWGL